MILQVSFQQVMHNLFVGGKSFYVLVVDAVFAKDFTEELVKTTIEDAFVGFLLLVIFLGIGVCFRLFGLRFEIVHALEDVDVAVVLGGFGLFGGLEVVLLLDKVIVLETCVLLLGLLDAV